MVSGTALKKKLSYRYIVLRSAYSALIASLIVWLFFPDRAGLGATVLCGLELRTLVDKLLNRNRRLIWDEKVHPGKANTELALQFITIFVTVFFIFGILELCFGEKGALTMSPLAGAPYLEVLKNNLTLLTAGVLLSLLFAGGGLLLILNWNAFHWSTSLVYFGFAIGEGKSSPLEVAFAVGSWLPHLSFEIVGFAVGGLAGVFMSKAIRKYSFGSYEMKRVASTALLLLAVSVVIIAVTSALEASLAFPAPNSQ